MLKKHNDIIILSIIWIISIYSVITAITSSYILGIQNYLGYGLLTGVSVLRFFTVKRFKTILGGLLVIGSVNAIQFTASTFTFFFKFSWLAFGDKSFSLGFQPLSALLLFFLVVFNFNDFKQLMKFLLSDDPKDAAERKRRIADKHYDELKNEKDSALNDILANKHMYQPEYVKAAQRVAEERKQYN